MTLVFPKNKMYSFKKDMNGVIEYPKSNKDMSWIFIFDEPILVGQEEDVKKPVAKKEKEVEKNQ